MTSVQIVDADDLYRSVRAGEYTILNGRVTFSASAFNDRERKPSVDAASLRADPRESRRSTADGIAKLVAGEVRQTCKVIIFDKKGKPTGEHSVDVVHRPIKDDPDGEPDNAAHCQVECHPAIDTDSKFRRLKEALAAMATRYGFIVAPGTP